jgi:peptidyl-prolyl cis-trans isomerase D
MNVPLQTLSAYPRSGDPNAFANNAPVVQAVFAEDVVASGNNSKLIELADDRVLVLRVTAHHPPAPLPLDSVAEQIRTDLARAAAVERARAAADEFYREATGAPATDGAEVGAASAAADDGDVEAASAASDDAPVGAASAAIGRDLAALAAKHGGVWNAPRWVERTAADVPGELVSVAFGATVPLPVEGVAEIVPMAAGDYAVLALYAVTPGDPQTIPLEQRDRQQLQRIQESAISELTAYAADVRDRASVRIPDEILEPQR